MTKQYYTLRYERTDALHKAGDQLANADNTLHIGQNDSCEVRLTNDSQYEDAVIAVIKKRTDNKGWKLIKVSPYKEHEVRVNGTPVTHVHFLNNGDRIAFEGQRQELVFSLHEDNQYRSNDIINIQRRGNHAVVAWLLVVSIALIGFILYQRYSHPMSEDMIAKAKQSVFQIQVNTVTLEKCQGDSTVVLESIDLYDEFGTAFLTTEGMLVTARHCIEPWLNLPEGTVLDTVTGNQPTIYQMALKAVTNNTIAESQGDDTRWKIISHCSIWKPDECDTLLFATTSEAFIINDSRDHIMALGDFAHQYFWRSIKVKSQRSDMMLGDIAYLPDAASRFHRKGTISLASKEEVMSLCHKPNRSLVIMGRTAINTNDRQIQSPEAHLLLQLDDTHCKDGYPNTVIAHDGKIGPGFSGGPVMTRKGLNGWCAIGVVSVTDSNEDGWYYSVPVSEIERMNNKN